jgi:hypothetical protein
MASSAGDAFVLLYPHDVDRRDIPTPKNRIDQEALFRFRPHRPSLEVRLEIKRSVGYPSNDGRYVGI